MGHGAHQLTDPEAYRPYLKAGIPYGLLAFLLGTIVSVQFYGAQVLGGLTVAEGAFMYAFSHGVVLVTGPADSGLMLFREPQATALWAVVIAFPLLVLGYVAARRADLDDGDPVEAAKVGGSLAAGYAVALVVVALFVDLDVSTLSIWVTGQLSLNPVTALFGGIVYGGAFGALGGVSRSLPRGRYAIAAFGTVSGLLTILLLLGSSG